MLLSTLLLLLAEGQPQQQTPWWYPLILPAGILFIFYFLGIRPGLRQQRERDMLLSSLKKNDKVLLAAGIYGTIVEIADNEDKITVKVDDNTRLKVTKGSIARNLSGEEALAAARAAGQPAKAAAAAPEQGIKAK
jgi:preprotein translocase subunit YajC